MGANLAQKPSRARSRAMTTELRQSPARDRLSSPVKCLFLIVVLAGVAGCDDCAAKPAAEDAAKSAPRADASALVNTTVLPPASVMKLVNPAGNPPYAGETGSVEGTIRVDGDPPVPTPFDFSRCPDAEKTWGKSFREGKD